jgi:DHA1 family multidrug resistance protein-like MFS transporter
MVTQFRDTQFGKLLRLLSANRLFPYPDEIDHSIRMRFHERAEIERSGSLEQKFPTGEKAPSSRRSPDTTPQAPGTKEDILEAGPDAYLVDWYGPDDPEVCIPPFVHTEVC